MPIFSLFSNDLRSKDEQQTELLYLLIMEMRGQNSDSEYQDKSMITEPG